MQFECDGAEVELTLQLVEQWKVQVRVDICDQAEPVGVEPGNRHDVLYRLDPRGARTVFAEQQRVINAFVNQESVQRRRVGRVSVIRIPPWVVTGERVRPFQPRRFQRVQQRDMHMRVDDCATVDHNSIFYRYLTYIQDDVVEYRRLPGDTVVVVRSTA